MQKNTLIICLVIVVIAVLLTMLYLIDMNQIKNNKPVVFSTWGLDYVPPVIDTSSFEIIDTTTICAEALEQIYSDEQYTYYLNCMKSQNIKIKFANNEILPLREVLEGKILTIYQLIEGGLVVHKEEK